MALIAQADDAGRVRLPEQPVHFLDAQKFGQALAKFRRLDGGRGIVVDVALHQREAEEMANRHEMPRHRAAIEAPLVQRGEEIDHVAAA